MGARSSGSRGAGARTETLEHERPDAAPVARPRLLVAWSPCAEAIGRSLPLLPGEPLRLGRGVDVDGVALEDPSLSREHALATVDDDGMLCVADRGSKNGTFTSTGRVARATLAPGALLQVGRTFLAFTPATSLQPVLHDGELAGVGEAARRMVGAVRQAGAHDRPVLLEGESGTGKEVAARDLHRASGRTGPFVAVNCATLERELAGAELFGHVRGTFTGAARTTDGLFRAAEGGTLFLDEVGTLPRDLQPKLLRALQERKVRRVGEELERPVDVRVVAATNVALAGLVAVGEFRLDLRARLAAARIELPPLAARREDIPVLARALLRRHGLAGAAPTPRLLWALFGAAWPTNVRGLAHVLLAAADERQDALLDLGPAAAAALADVAAGSAPAAAPPGGVEARGAAAGTPVPRPPAARPDRAALEAALVRAHGNVREVARALAAHRAQVYRWLAHHGLDPACFRPEDTGKGGAR